MAPVTNQPDQHFHRKGEPADSGFQPGVLAYLPSLLGPSVPLGGANAGRD